MKKNVRLVLLFALIAVMLVMTAVFASAKTVDVAAGGDLTAAISGAAAGDTINVKGDVALTATVTIDKNLNITGTGTIDVTGCTAVAGFEITSGTVTFSGVTIKRTSGTGNYPMIHVKGESSKLIINSGTYASDHETMRITEGASMEMNGGHIDGGTSGNGILLNKIGTLKITGGLIDGYRTITAAGNASYTGEIIMSGGTIASNATQVNNVGITLQYIDMTITGGTIISSGSMISKTNQGVKKQVNISGGTFIQPAGSGKKFPAFNVGDSGVTINISGGDFYFYEDGAVAFNKANGSYNITGGTFTLGNNVTFFQNTAGSLNGTVNFSNATINHYGDTGVLFNLLDTIKTFTLKDLNIYTKNVDVITIAEGKTPTTYNFTGCTVTSYDRVIEGIPAGNTVQQAAPLFAIGSTTYRNFADALAAVTANGTITLKGDVRWPISINNTTAFTLDGDGHSISNELYVAVSSGQHTISISNGADVTLKNVTIETSEGQRVYGMHYRTHYSDSSLLVYAIANNGKCTIEDTVTVYGVIYAHYYAENVLTIKGGTFKDGGIFNHSSRKASTVFLNSAGTTIIQGGTFEMDGINSDAAVTTNDQNANLVITGGTFKNTGKGYALCAQSNLTLSIKGGKFETADSSAVNVLIGVVKGDSNETDENGNAIDAIDTFTLQDFEAVGGNVGIRIMGKDNVTLKNVKISGTSGYAVNTTNGVANATTITLDNCTINVESYYGINANGAQILIKSGTYSATNSAHIIRLGDNDFTSHVTVEGGKFTVADGDVFYGTSGVADVKLIIKGGEYTATGAGRVLTLSNPTRSWQLVEITGGTFVTNSGACVHAAGADVKISGETSMTSASVWGVISLYDSDIISNVTIEGGAFTAQGDTHVIRIAPATYTKIELPEVGSAADYKANTNCLMGDVVINGGTFSAKNGYVIFHASNKSVATNNLTINGGKFAGEGEAVLYVASPNANTVIDINGGRFVLTGKVAGGAVIKTGTYLSAEGAIDTGNIDPETEEKIMADYYINAGCTINIDNAMLVNSTNVGSVVVDDSYEDSTATITWGEGIIALALTEGDFTKGMTETAVAGDGGKVKFNGTHHYVWMSLAGDADAELDEGAKVRVIAGGEGIRFIGSAAKVENAVYGVLIAPVDYVTAAGAFTQDALDQWAADNGVAVAYQMVEAKNSLKDNGDNVSFSVALVNIKSGNYGRGFAAVAYVKVGDTISYSDYDSTANARSMAQVAAAALADEKDAADVDTGYIYLNEETGKYSKYTLDQRTVLKGYVG